MKPKQTEAEDREDEVVSASRPRAWRALSLSLAFALALLPNALAQTLTVLTHDSFAMPETVIQAFTEATGIELEFLAAGDAGEVVNRAILTRERPLADLLYGIDDSLLPRARAADLFEPYRSPLLEAVDERYRFDPEHLVTPVDVGFVAFNLDRAFFEQSGTALPDSLAALTEPRYRSLTAVSNPTTSSPGLAFMLTTVAAFGEEGWLEYWAALRDNDLLVTSGWSDAYYTAFSRYGGDRPIVLSYASSPAAEVIFAEEALTSAPTMNLLCEACVYQQIEAVGILRGTDQLEAAQAFIDFMLGERFQSALAENMFVYPVREDAALPETFAAHAERPAEAELAALPAEQVEAELRRWLAEWSGVVEQGRSPEDVRRSR